MAKGPEAQLQKLILDWLAAKHIFAMRMNSGAMFGEHKGKSWAVRFGTPGCADILAFPQNIGSERGYVNPLWIECKAPKGKQSELQASFQKQVEAEGHMYIIARDLQDVLAILG